MGDIASHGRIAAHVVEQLRKVASTTTIPTTDYSFLELGNFITDVEQFRDPVAFHKARELVRDEAKRAAGVGGFLVEIDRWANEMFGVKGEKVTGPRHGAVPEFLSEVARAFTHHVFDPDGLTAQIAKAPFAGAAAGFLPLHPIDPPRSIASSPPASTSTGRTTTSTSRRCATVRGTGANSCSSHARAA